MDNFYKTTAYITMMAPVVLVPAVIMWVTGNELTLFTFIGLSVLILTMGAISSVRKDAEAGWNKYELILPVKRKEIIGSKYLNYLFWVFVTIIITVICAGITFLLHDNILYKFGRNDFIMMFIFCVGVAILEGAIYYPMVNIFGADKGEPLISIAMVVSIIITAPFFLPQLNSMGRNSKLLPLTGIYLLACVLIYMVSYFLMCHIYNKKELH